MAVRLSVRGAWPNVNRCQVNDLEAGSALWRHDEDIRHLWFVISNPVVGPDNIVMVNLTSWKPGRDARDRVADPACMVYVGDHGFVTCESCVYYAGATIMTTYQMEQRFNRGALRFHDEKASDALVKRMREGASKTVHLPDAAYYALLEQKVIVV
jgi:hypothetical protein